MNSKANVIPDIEWYSSKSKNLKLTPRCPIASAELCPRYYYSIWLLGEENITTKISDQDKARLDKRWEPFKPTIREEEPGAISIENELSSIKEFCPEVSYQIFGYFVSGLHRYPDETNSDLALKMLSEEGADRSDPRWHWWTYVPRHYTECREYSLFKDLSLGKPQQISSSRKSMSPALRWQIFARDSFTCQYCGRKAPDVVLEVDHQVPIVHGGNHDPDNLITSCTTCNRGKATDIILP